MPVPADSAYTDADLERGWEEPIEEDDDEPVLPQRRRMRWLTGKSALLFALLVGLAGFYVGVRVEKSSASSSSGTTVASASGATLSGAPSFAGRGASGAATSSSSGASRSGSRTGGFPSGGAGGFPSGGAGGFPGGGGFGGGGTRGTVASVDGKTIYVKESSGNTIKVKLLSTTILTKSESVGKKSVHPGDTVSIEGATKGASITATSVTDSGNDSTSSSSTSSGSSSSAG
jgi:hypothetical protein